MGSRRTQRLGNLILAELAQLLLRKVKDPRVADVSLTAVDVSPDLRQAKVYYSLLDPTRRDEAQKGFEAASAFLRHELAVRLHLKIIPRLIPVYDPSLIEGAAMDELIRKVRSEDELQARDRDDSEPGPGDEDQ